MGKTLLTPRHSLNACLSKVWILLGNYNPRPLLRKISDSGNERGCTVRNNYKLEKLYNYESGEEEEEGILQEGSCIE